MQINQSEVKDLTTVVSITLEPADYQETVLKELKKIRQKANMPGFRVGNVPLNLIKKMYGKSVLADVLNQTVSDKLFEYIREQKLNILGEPLPNEEQTPQIDFDNDDTFTLAFDLALAPEFDAKLTAKNKLTEYKIEVTDAMIDEQVKGYAERYGTYSDADEYQKGDLLRGLLTEQKENGISKENAVLNPEYMSDKKQLALFNNCKTGDVITFNPKKAYNNDVEVSSMLGISKEEAAALESDFTFQISVITRHTAAAVDQELFDKVYGAGAVADESAFRARIKTDLENHFAEDCNYKFGLDVKQAIMKKMEKLQFPEDFLRRWLKTSNKDMTDEKLEKDFPAMIEELKWYLAKDQLTKEFNINVEKDEVEAYARRMAKMQFLQYGLSNIEDKYLDNFAQDMLKNEDQLRGIVERVAENKLYEAVRTVVKIEEKTISRDDFSKLFE